MVQVELQPRPRIIDATLREGAQAPGVRFGIDESREIARALVSIGVDTVECGHPQAGDQEMRRVAAVVAACGRVPVLSHARARIEDVDRVHAAGAQWVGIFAGVNSISRSCRINSTEPLDTVIGRTVAHAKTLGLRVRLTVEDGSRTPWDELVSAYRAALRAGADRLCFADTVGVLCPWETAEIVGSLCNEFAGTDFEVHFHDDRGMANANALTAVRAGASWVSSCVNGIGERCGITDTLTLQANLASQGWRPLIDGAALQKTSTLVQAHSRLHVDHWRPVVGRNAFTHVARLHRRAVEIDERAYSWIPPEVIGRVCSNEPPAAVPVDNVKLINQPEIVPATELKHHRRGPGDRYLMLDDRVVSDARQYCIVRDIPALEDYGRGHVDAHRHHVDSLFLFLGREEGMSGLRVEVRLGDQLFTVDSPSSVFIPSGVWHSYRVIGGEGLFVNHVLAGEYNSSLLDAPEVGTAESAAAAAAREFVEAFVRDRLPGTTISPSFPLLELFDSLLFLDFFLHIESTFGDVVSLDDVSSCRTFGELYELLSRLNSQEAAASM